jgi:hypothetical protein
MATNREMLKEAIADAKAVKETAIANAKAALEEAFTPQLTSMLSMKLQEMEKEELEEEGFGDFDTKENTGFNQGMDEKALDEEEDKMMEIDLEELLAELNEEEDIDEAINEAEEEEEEESEESEEGEEEGEPIDLEDMTDEDLKSMIEDVIKDMIEAGELEAGNEDMEGEEGVEGEEEIEIEDEEEIDLAELLREIEGMDEEEDMIKEEEIEEGFMNKIIKAVNRFGSSGAVEDLIKINLPKAVVAGKRLGKLDSSYEPSEEEINKLTADAKEDGGTGSIDIIKGKLAYIPGLETKGSAQASTFESVQSELEEAYSTIETLKSELNEINLLNAKLLYTNKIFKAKNLNESQKVKVLSSFDKAKNVGEVKMVFETLNEGIKVSKNPLKEHLGSASKTTNTPSVKKPIVESNEAFLRMQKLAGII